MSKFFTRWFGKDKKTRPIVHPSRKTNLRLEVLEVRDVPATLMVTSLADVLNGAGELRTQVAAANSGDTIEFASYLSGGTVDLSNGQIDITKSITIESAPNVGLVTINGQDEGRVFDVTSANTAFYINGLELENGKTNDSGGGINTNYNSDDVFVSNSTITGCTAGTMGGGIYADNSLTMVDSSVTNNTAATRGGGIFTNGAGTIQTSNISGNTATNNSGGGVWCSNYLSITQSTIADNTAGGSGGGVRALGAAASVTMVNCTVYKNSAQNDGGGISIKGYGTDSFTNNTIVSNSAATGSGGGLAMYLYGTTNGYTLYGYLTNDIVANDTANVNPDVYGTIRQVYCDITSNTGITQLGGSGGNISSQPDLGPLQNNGGPTETLLPRPTSPVINAGTSGNAPTVDQRNIPRPQGTAWDIGSVEVRGFGFSIVSGNFQSTPENQLFGAPLVVQIYSPDEGNLANQLVTFKIGSAANGASGIPLTPVTVLTNSQGEASLTLQANNSVGTFRVQASTNLPYLFGGNQTLFFTLTIVDSAHTLEFAQQPQAITAGQPQTVTILALNSQDKVALNFDGSKFPVNLYLINAAGSVVEALGTVDGVDGVATFNNIVLNNVAVGDQFKAIAPELTALGDVSYISSIPFDVVPNQPSTGRRRT